MPLGSVCSRQCSAIRDLIQPCSPHYSLLSCLCSLILYSRYAVRVPPFPINNQHQQSTILNPPHSFREKITKSDFNSRSATSPPQSPIRNHKFALSLLSILCSLSFPPFVSSKTKKSDLYSCSHPWFGPHRSAISQSAIRIKNQQWDYSFLV